MAKTEKDKTSYRKRAFSKRGIVIFLLRLCLGGFFIYVSLHKIRSAAQFKDIVANYEILPYWIINITAMFLPWLEFWIGALLIAGIFIRSCAIIQGILLVIFILAIGLNIARGFEFYCGCFAEDSMVASINNHWHIIFNIFWLLMAATLFILERRRFSHRFFSKHMLQR